MGSAKKNDQGRVQVPPRAQIAVEGAKADPLPTEFVNPGLLDVRCRELWFRKFEFVIFFGFVVVVLCGRVGALCGLHSVLVCFLFRLHFHTI